MERSHQLSQKKRSLKIVLILISVVMSIATLFSLWLVFVIVVPVSDESAEGARILIEENESALDIGKELEEQGLIRSAFGFMVYVELTDSLDALRPGEYVLLPSSARTVTAVLSQAQTPTRKEVSITVIEGWDSNEIQDYLVEQQLPVGDFGRTVDEAAVQNPDSLLFEGKPKNSSLEGYLFPDTYTVYDDVSSQELIDMMIAHFESQITDEMKEQIEESEMSFYEILTLASIVEKEVAQPEDRRIVAGIFLQRLEDEYPLQSDATVNFITGKNTTRPSGEDLTAQSPYNSYLFPGLPPGPISNPSLDAIQSVLEAEETEYYYFLTTLENETIFSKTFEEHTENTYRYYPE